MMNGDSSQGLKEYLQLASGSYNIGHAGGSKEVAFTSVLIPKSLMAFLVSF
jgi:hypothetical protein